MGHFDPKLHFKNGYLYLKKVFSSGLFDRNHKMVFLLSKIFLLTTPQLFLL